MNRFSIYPALLLTGLMASSPATSGPYQATTTVDETRQQIRKLPNDDIWWMLNGTDMRWNNLNLSKFVPTVTVNRAGQVRELPVAPNPAIGQVKVDTPKGQMSFQEFLASDQSTTMAVMILHKGRVVFEQYPQQQRHDKPLFWSVTKAFVSTVLAIMEDRGEVDVDQSVDHYIPRLTGSVFEGVPVRDVLDMASGIDCADEYLDKQSCYYRYSSSIGEGFRPEGSPDNPYDYVASLSPKQRFAEPGKSYSYSGVNTFVLGWLVEVISGMPFQDVLSKEIWTQMGAEADGLIWAGRYGIPLTSGGLMSRVSDMARFGLLFTPSYGVVSDRKIISDRYLQHILHGGRPELMENSQWGNVRGEHVRHNVYQWDTVWDNDDFIKGGWAGQGLMINPSRDLVAVWTGYYREDGTQVSVQPMIRSIWGEIYSSD